MGVSQHVPLRQVRGIYRVLGDVRDLRDDPAAQAQALLLGLCGAIGARQGAMVRFTDFTPTGDTALADFATTDWTFPAMCARWREAMHRGPASARTDPLVDRCARRRGARGTLLREQLMPDREWARADNWVYEASAAADIGSHLILYQRHSRAGDAVGIVLHRGRRDRRFGPRDRAALHLFNEEFYHLHAAGKLRPRRAAPHGSPNGSRNGSPQSPAAAGDLGVHLSPRQRQVLHQLLAGRSVKQAAAHLGLSRHTVEDYVKSLHRALAVHSRAELMARFLARHHD